MTFNQEVVGEAHYQDAFEEICGPRCADGESREVAVLLVPEPNNQYDLNAVAVTVEGLTVGYLPRESAALLRKNIGTKRLSCLGKIVGGWERDDSIGHYGIRLDMKGSKIIHD